MKINRWYSLACAALALTGGAPYSARGASPAPCHCADIPQIEARLAQAAAAIAAYRTQIAGIESKEITGGKTIPATFDNYPKSILNPNSLETRVDNALSQVDQSIFGLLDKPTSSTDENCNVHITTTNACIRADLEQHEAVHVAACQAAGGAKGAKDRWNRGDLAAWWGTERLADMAREEIRGWQAEQKFLLEQLRIASQDPGCTHAKWFGTVTQIESSDSHGTSTDPATSTRGVLTHETKNVHLRTVNATIFERYAYVAVSVSEVSTEHTSAHEKVKCGSNNSPDYDNTADSGTTSQGTGFQTYELTPTLSGDHYSISIPLPEYDLLVDHTAQIAADPCGHDNKPSVPPHAVIHRKDAAISISGTFPKSTNVSNGNGSTPPITTPIGHSQYTFTWEVYRGTKF